MTFQELAIYLNYNGPSGAEKAYKAALRKRKRTCTAAPTASGSPRRKPSAPPKAEAEQDAGHHATPQRTWWDEKELTDRFSCEVASLVCVYEMLKSSFDHSF